MNSADIIYQRSSDKYDKRKMKIDTITIHCYVGQVTAKQGVDYMCETERECSVNYVCGTDGNGLMIPEEFRPWTSSTELNDTRAVTFETACDPTAPYYVRDDVLERLIRLVADVCRRNGIEKLVWSENREERVGHLNGCNITLHKDFADTMCPGEYLIGKMPYIADRVNELLFSGKI